MKTHKASPALANLQVLIAGILFGTAGTAVTYAPASASTTGLGIMRLFIGALVLIVLLPRFGSSGSEFIKLFRHKLVWVMAICSAAYQPLFFGATKNNGVAVSTLLAVSFIPIVAAFVGRVFLKEPITKAWLAATGLALIGLTLRSLGELEVKQINGVFMAIAAGATVGFYLNAAKVELANGTNQIALPAMAYLIGSLLLLPLLGQQSLSWVATGSGLVIAIYLGVVTMALANALQISGLRSIGPASAGTLTLADPFTATILGVLVLGEGLDLIGVIGICLVAVALIWQARVKVIGDGVIPL
jgi:DME family drug/metabolite transporter